MGKVARFFLVQNTQTWKNIQNYLKMYQMAKDIPNGCQIFQMAIKYTNIFHSKAGPKHTQICVFGLKIYYLATLDFGENSSRKFTRRPFSPFGKRCERPLSLFGRPRQGDQMRLKKIAKYVAQPIFENQNEYVTFSMGKKYPQYVGHFCN
jgi:hypothetical protein